MKIWTIRYSDPNYEERIFTVRAESQAYALGELMRFVLDGTIQVRDILECYLEGEDDYED